MVGGSPLPTPATPPLRAEVFKAIYHVPQISSSSCPFLKPLPFLGICDSSTSLQVPKPVLVSYCCCNLLPQIWWLKTTQIYHFIASEVRNPKLVLLGENQGVGRILFFLEALGRNPFPRPCQRLEAVCIPWLAALFSSTLLVTSASLTSPPPPLSYKDPC